MKRECPSLEPLLHDYAEGWLAESKQASVLSHLQRCPACQEKLQAWSAVSNALRGMPRLPAPEPAPAPVQEAEPRFALRLALALCLPVALLIATYNNAWQPPSIENLAPYTTLHALFERAQEQLLALWAWLRGVL
ncbi:MAG: hypothetical protein NZM28_07640 [Fimbriimonadales bacterium]|nr:hypothetical protein [Fimbriimonadales bacterium]